MAINSGYGYPMDDQSISEKARFTMLSIMFTLEEALGTEDLEYNIGRYAKGPFSFKVKLHSDKVLSYRIKSDGSIQERGTCADFPKRS